VEGSSIQSKQRMEHQRSADRQHLLLASGQSARDLLAALFEHGEEVVNRLQLLLDLVFSP
jgi:DNA-binding winged helix-turn-helix (wHTH) protein